MIPADLRLRLVAAFLTVAALSQIDGLFAAAGAAVAALGVALAHRAVPWRRLVHLEGFLVLLFVSLPFTVPGSPLVAIGPLTASVEGVVRAATLACKVSAAVLVVATFLAGMEPVRLGAALRGLGVPEPFVRLFVATARYLGLVREEARRLLEAMRARGFRLRSNRHTWRSVGYLIGMLLVRAMARAERIEEAMLCRGYSGRVACRAVPAPAARDWLCVGVSVAGAAALLAVDRL